MKFAEFARICEEIEGIPGRLEMVETISRILPGLDAQDLPLFVQFVTGKIFPDWSPLKLGIGPNLLFDAITLIVDGTRSDVIGEINRQGDVGLAVQAILGKGKISRRSSQTATIQTPLFSRELDLAGVFSDLEEIARQGGRASQQEKLALIQNLFQNASPLEGRYLARLLMEDLRIGVGEGTMRDAIARAFSVDSSLVEHAYQARNDLGEVAMRARSGEMALRDVRILPFHPVKMMLAQQGTIPGAIGENGAMAAEFKYDGSRFQFHKSGTESRIYSRKLEDVTDALPDILEALEGATTHDVILDGEVIAIRDGKPLPFQTVLRRFRRKYGVEAMQKEVMMRPFVFDILYLDGETLIDLSFQERRSRLEAVVSAHVTPQTVSGDTEEIERIYHESLAAGHEGLMLKVLSSPYTPGIRGKNWLKIKPTVDTLDLAVIGAEWGEGKRAHVFGSFLLACQDQGELRALSKVATGFSDEQLSGLYDLFKDHVLSESGKEVQIEPFLVFEVGYSEIQESPNYDCGYALRFPRFIRIRDDKAISDIETVAGIRERYQQQQK
ncbi:MAG: ATP-dependent DNA ligase [Methanolinea sp.]|jgi:DNA ligase-1|nr:ATP-dependent DNA ligase [Methanolinea sp.]